MRAGKAKRPAVEAYDPDYVLALDRVARAASTVYQSAVDRHEVFDAAMRVGVPAPPLSPTLFVVCLPACCSACPLAALAVVRALALCHDLHEMPACVPTTVAPRASSAGWRR